MLPDNKQIRQSSGPEHIRSGPELVNLLRFMKETKKANAVDKRLMNIQEMADRLKYGKKIKKAEMNDEKTGRP